MKKLLIFLFLACIHFNLIACKTGPDFEPGTILIHEAGLNFKVPHQVYRVETYILGEYNRDKDIIIRMGGPRSYDADFSIVVRRFEKSDGHDLFGIINARSRFFKTNGTITASNLDRVFTKVPIANLTGWGKEYSNLDTIYGYVIFIERENDILVITYSAKKEYDKFSRSSFNEFLDSISFEPDY